MDYFPRKSLSKYFITDTIEFNKHVHDIDMFINVFFVSKISVNGVQGSRLRATWAKKSPCEG
jgi:hypothetical protein